MSLSNSYLFKDTFVLALITFAGYIAAYSYEWGYFSYFGIPTYLIHIPIESILSAVFILGIYFLVSSTIVIWLLGTKIVRSIYPKSPLIKWLIGCVAIVAIALAFSNANSLVIVLAPIIFFLQTLILVLLLHPDKDRWTKQPDAKTQIMTPIESLLFRKEAKPYTVIVVILFLIVLLAYFLGSGVAQVQKPQLFFENNLRNYLLVRAYGDYRIAVEFDNSKNVLTDNILLLPSNEVLSTKIESLPLLKKSRDEDWQTTVDWIKKAVSRIEAKEEL